MMRYMTLLAILLALGCPAAAQEPLGFTWVDEPDAPMTAVSVPIPDADEMPYNLAVPFDAHVKFVVVRCVENRVTIVFKLAKPLTPAQKKQMVRVRRLDGRPL